MVLSAHNSAFFVNDGIEGVLVKGPRRCNVHENVVTETNCVLETLKGVVMNVFRNEQKLVGWHVVAIQRVEMNSSSSNRQSRRINIERRHCDGSSSSYCAWRNCLCLRNGVIRRDSPRHSFCSSNAKSLRHSLVLEGGRRRRFRWGNMPVMDSSLE